MIVQIRGTSGSGKSTVVREVMNQYANRLPVRIPGEKRKQPIGYLCTRPNGRALSVIGHYETACGGCDTLPTYDRIIELVREAHAAGNDVLFEGLLISGEVQRCSRLAADGLPYRVLALDVDIDECVASVNRRRRVKDPNKPDVNPANTVAKHRTVQGAMRRLEEAGVRTEWVTRERAASRVLELLWDE